MAPTRRRRCSPRRGGRGAAAAASVALHLSLPKTTAQRHLDAGQEALNTSTSGGQRPAPRRRSKRAEGKSTTRAGEEECFSFFFRSCGDAARVSSMRTECRKKKTNSSRG